MSQNITNTRGSKRSTKAASRSDKASSERSSRVERNQAARSKKKNQASDSKSSQRNQSTPRLLDKFTEFRERTLNFVRDHTKLVVFLCVVLFLIVGLYPPVRGYYHAMREHDELVYNQKKLEEDQKRLQDEVNNLQTKEGIEEKAHEHGYVSNGEESAKVVGLEGKKDEQDSHRPAAPWYIQVGDFIFGFSINDSKNTDAPKSANSDDSTSASTTTNSHESNDKKSDSSADNSASSNADSNSESSTNDNAGSNGSPQ